MIIKVKDVSELKDAKPLSVIGAGDKVWEVMPKNYKATIVTFDDGKEKIELNVREMGKLRSKP